MNFIRATPFNGLGPNYSTAFITDDNVKTWYDAMQLQVERPLSRSTRWGGSLAYTLAKVEEQGQPSDLFWGFDGRFPTVGDMPRKQGRGSQVHTLIANGISRLPYDFLLSGIVSYGSGIRETATDASGGFGPFQQTYYIYTGDATQNLDLRVQKALRTARGQNATLIVDLFNATGAKNWGCFDKTINPTSGPPNANYGRAGCAGLGRRLQVGLRYGYRGGDDTNR